MTTTSKQPTAAPCDTVYFRFEGKPGTGVDEIDVFIHRQDLKAFPDSLLTKLAEDSWKSDDNPTAGDTEANPLITRPLDAPCREEWSPCLAVMIAETYRWKQAELRIIDDDQAKEGIHPALPPDVAMEDALSVLEYYGLTLEDPSIIRLDHLDTEGQICAKLFLKDLALIDEAADLVFEELKQNPQRETLFLFARRCHNMQYINEHNYLEEFHDAEKFIRIGSDQECNQHLAWAKDAYLRHLFIEQIRKELPSFDVNYLDSLVPDDSCGGGGECRVATQPHSRQPLPYYENLVVLRVRAPLRKPSKRPRPA